MIVHEKYYNNIDKTAILVPSYKWKKYIKMLFNIRKPVKPNIITMNYEDAINFIL